MTIAEALERRIPRIRSPRWSNPEAYLRLPLLPGGCGPWAELYDEPGQEALGKRPGSQRLMIIPHGASQADGLEPSGPDGWEEYTGPVSDWEACEKNLAIGFEEE